MLKPQTLKAFITDLRWWNLEVCVGGRGVSLGSRKLGHWGHAGSPLLFIHHELNRIHLLKLKL